jgi:hypothetical protein
MKRRLTPPGHPERLGQQIYALLHEPSHDPVLTFARATWRMTSRAGLPHIVLVAALFDLLPAFFVGAAVGVHLVWPVALYLERLLGAPHARPTPSVAFAPLAAPARKS